MLIFCAECCKMRHFKNFSTTVFATRLSSLLLSYKKVWIACVNFLLFFNFGSMRNFAVCNALDFLAAAARIRVPLAPFTDAILKGLMWNIGSYLKVPSHVQKESFKFSRILVHSRQNQNFLGHFQFFLLEFPNVFFFTLDIYF